MSGRRVFYEYKPTCIHRLHPITQLYGLVWLVLLSFISPTVHTSLALLLTIMAVSMMARLFRRVFSLVCVIVVPILVFLVLVHGFLNPANETILYSFTVLGITAELGKEGLIITYNLVSKLCLILPSFFLFVSVTSPERLMPSLIQKGVPPAVSYLFLATLNVLPYMRSKMETIQMAQQARGVSMEGGLLTRIRAILPLLMPLILSSLGDIQARSVTLEVRSFGVSRRVSSLYNLEERRIDKILQMFFVVSGLAAAGAASTAGQALAAAVARIVANMGR